MTARRVLVVLAGALALGLAVSLLGPAATPRAVGDTSSAVSVQTDDAVPARGPVMIGSSPAEAPGETWGIGEVGAFNGGAFTIVRYSEGAGWSVAPWLRADGQPGEGVLKPDSSPLTGETTPNGAGVLVGTVASTPGEQGREVVLVRDPGGGFRETPVPEEGEAALLKAPDESLFSRSRAPLIAALDEGGRAGAFVVPVNSKSSGVEEDGVLHWDGHQWTREQIDVPPASKEHKDFRVLAIGASSPGNAWLLAQLSQQASPGAVELFRRHVGSSGTPAWWPVARPGGVAGEPLSVVLAGGEEAPLTVEGIGDPPTAGAQILTVTDEGVWVDGQGPGSPLTMFFKPEHDEASEQETEEERYSGHALASWCTPGSVPACIFTLPESLPSGPSRSFAWSDPANPYHVGQRVISGLNEGVSLRLQGASFERVLALGAGEQSFEDVGGSHGAAFSSPTEGWLGNVRMPVHVTQRPAPNRLAPYPAPFHHALLAIAPQPGGPVGALSSQALAVGDQGEVARYAPGQGWLPEGLLGSGGRRVAPPLRAVAWPTPSRAYAVGQLDARGDPQMWLWRGETGLWEADPAAPRNFRGNLLGIAFDPNNPARGYAVGQEGVLLRYGKSWAQDSLPPEVAGASFTSIAFAGSQALVAFRIPHREGGGEGAHYTGGLLVNDGSGWRVDQDAGAGLAGGLPWAVAGLSDGGAALSGVSAREEPLVLERNDPAAAWQSTPVPYAGGEPPGSLALFREGGALRVVGSGGIPNTGTIDFPEEHVPPAGFPPQLIKAYPPTAGYVRRQTAAGWSDEEHDRDELGAPRGEFKSYDLPYKPDPTSAVLIDSTGTQGWAVGGQLEARRSLDTADVARYPADGVPPPGFAAAPVQVEPNRATFAIGGNAQCAAACADRANAALGPDVWLSSALQEAAQIQGMRAFLYTGARVSTGEGRVHAAPVPRRRELARYAAVLGSSSLPAFAAPSPTDPAGGEGEQPFKEAFAGFPAPFGNTGATAGLMPVSGSLEPCTAQCGYYAVDSSGAGGNVRMIVLDQSSTVAATQLGWLNEQLAAVRGTEPAIVIGNAPAQGAVAQALINGRASAYFYDSPEQNVRSRVGGSQIPSFGSGTLGYMNALSAERQDFIGHSGLLLVQVGALSLEGNTRAPVTARLIPAIGELALEGQDGVLLRRSQPALFDGLARRPRAGCVANGSETRCETSQYIPIPANCVGNACASANLPEYTFSSSRPDIGDFVEPNLASPDPRAVLLGPNDKPIPDSQSGLFCAYNGGTTVVTISAGGRSASLTVTVQAGSVRRPCGTQPLQGVVNQQQAAAAPPPAPAPAPAPAAGPAPAGSAPSVPLPAPPTPQVTSPPPHPSPPAPFFLPGALPAPLLAFVPPPLPTPARPTPPSGTSAVTSPVEAVEKEEEYEEAPESVSNKAVAYRSADHEPSPAYLIGIIVLAALAGASIGRPVRRGRREVRVAPATLSTLRTQRRMSRRRDR
jgi:hypothetical protein